MITNITGNYNTNIGKDGLYNKYLSKAYPKLDSLSYRLTNIFLKKCSNEVNNYSECIKNSDYKDNIFQYISLDKRIECYSTWNTLKQCAKKFIGDGFALKMDVSRQLNTNTILEEEEIDQENIKRYNVFMTNHLKFLKEDMPIEGEDEEEETE